MLSGRATIEAYGRAGSDFLADRIADMFQKIETKEQQALHNVILDEVMTMIGNDPANQKKFYQHLAHKIIEQKKKTWLKYVCESIMLIAKG